MKPLSIKDIFITNTEDFVPDTENSNENLNSDLVNENIENQNFNNRMVNLVHAFEKKDEIIKEHKEKPVDKQSLEKETERLKHLSTHRMNEAFGAPQINALGFNNHIHGQSVTSFIKNEPETVLSVSDNNNNPNTNKPFNPNYTYLHAGEALRLAISRVLNSGAPVNNLGFYEEVNWNLNNMGFNSQPALSIKQAVLKMLKD